MSKFILLDQHHLNVEIKELTREERVKLHRALRSLPDAVRGYIEGNIIPQELVNKVKITIEQ